MTTKSIWVSFIGEIRRPCELHPSTVQTRKTKSGQEYISLIVTAGTEGRVRQWWVRMSGSAAQEVFPDLEPGAQVYIEGTWDLVEARDGSPLPVCDAKKVVRIHQHPRPKPKPKLVADAAPDVSDRPANILADGRAQVPGGKVTFDVAKGDILTF